MSEFLVLAGMVFAAAGAWFALKLVVCRDRATAVAEATPPAHGGMAALSRLAWHQRFRFQDQTGTERGVSAVFDSAEPLSRLGERVRVRYCRLLPALVHIDHWRYTWLPMLLFAFLAAVMFWTAYAVR